MGILQMRPADFWDCPVMDLMDALDGVLLMHGEMPAADKAEDQSKLKSELDEWLKSDG